MTTPPLNLSPRLGSDADPIRQGLFAAQPLNEFLQTLRGDRESGPSQALAEAARLMHAGSKREAISVLKSILALSRVETRIQLWVWSALRELGVQPDPAIAYEVLGVVVEVPMRGEYDTLAAYQDGSARYLNFSGKAIFHDAPDAVTEALCRTLFQAAASAGSHARPRSGVALPKSGTHLTILARAGMFVVSNPPDPVVEDAAALMNELIRRARSA